MIFFQSIFITKSIDNLNPSTRSALEQANNYTNSALAGTPNTSNQPKTK